MKEQMTETNKPLAPPLIDMPKTPKGRHIGAFARKRRHHTHEGVDLHCAEGSLVFSMDYGCVVWIGPFTGPAAGTPWWRDTEAIAIKHAWGVMFYGEIEVFRSFGLYVGKEVRPGEVLGGVRRVLRNDKGNPMSMLHLELYEALPTQLPPPLWVDERPHGLLDPTPVLERVIRE